MAAEASGGAGGTSLTFTNVTTTTVGTIFAQGRAQPFFYDSDLGGTEVRVYVARFADGVSATRGVGEPFRGSTVIVRVTTAPTFFASTVLSVSR